MKILTPSEFKLENKDAYLKDYLTYLENAQTEAEKALEDALTFTMNDTAIEGIRKQAKEILDMATLVEEYMGQIVLKTVDTLKLEELQSYFDFKEEYRISDEKQANLIKEKEKILTRLDEVEHQIDRNLYLNGRAKDFYEVDDVEEFFSQNESPVEYLEKILMDFNAEELKKQMLIAIETEGRIQNFEFSFEDITGLCDIIMELFNKCLNILKYSQDAKEQLPRVILSGINQIFPENFDNNTAMNLINDLMNLKKINTEFYSSLPADLKESLAKKRLFGEPYNTLSRAYQAYLNGEELPSDDLSLEEKREKKELEASLEKVNFDLASLTTERKSKEEFLENEEAMRSVLREKIFKMVGDKVSASDIDFVIKSEETKLEKLKTSLSEASHLLATKTKDLEKAKAILVDPKYHDFFQAVGFKNDLRLYNRLGVKITDEFLLPFLETEKRREKQLDILITIENNLAITYNSIKNIKANFITKNFPSNKARLKELEEQYQREMQLAFEDLKINDLFYVNAPLISEESTVGNVIVLPPVESQKEPTNFNELSGLKQTFWDMPIVVDKNTQQKINTQNTGFDNWKDYCKDLMQKQENLVNKLFSFTKVEEEYYNFDSSLEEREQLKNVQKNIIEILNSVYDERKEVRKRLEEASTALDPNKVTELKYFLGDKTNPSKENLVYYMEQTESQIAELRNLLMNNRSICMELGISLPEDIKDMENTRKAMNNDLEAKIQNLHIDGVTNLEEAISYRNLLQGIEEYTVPANQVKKFYLERKKTI